ncbi:MAG TPA: hypothetical protein DCO71_09915 [Gammaproteobacteria bacterium]|nr:hypothetical protein [Gammaproteobacteria bacterium]
MKTSFHVKLLATALLSLWLVNGCASNSSNGGSKASSDATTAIANANDAIKAAKSNDWIWRDTEKFAAQAGEAAAAGDDAKAIKLANKAQFEAEAAVEQYNFEKTHPRSLQ